MPNFSVIGNASKNFFRRCTAASIPLCRAECRNQRTGINRFIKHWQFLQYQQQKQEQYKKYLKYIKNTTKNSFSNYRNPDHLWHYIRKVSTAHIYEAGEHDLNNNCTRISPEFQKVLQNYMPKSHSERSAKLINLKKRIPCNDPRALEIVNPSLAAYLRSVMENGGILNEVYGIDFYYNINEDNDRDDKYYTPVDPFMTALLLSKLGRGSHLTSKELLLLVDFLTNLPDLNGNELKMYIEILKSLNVLTPKIKAFLNELLQQLGIDRTNSLTKLFCHALEDTREVRRKRIIELNHDEIVLPRPQTSINSYLPSVSSTNHLSIIPSFDVSVPIDEPIIKPLKGLKHDGYFEPWDTSLKWKNLTWPFEKAIQRRASNMKTLAKYYRSDLQTIATTPAVAAAARAIPKPIRTTLEQPLPAAQTYAKIFGKRNGIKKVPSFIMKQ